MPPEPPDKLRLAYLVYRGNPHSGGQGVYTRHLTRELVGMGHSVTVFGGQPFPKLDAGVEWVPVPSLDLYREPDPFRVPWPWEFRSAEDVAEFAIMCSAGFPEPLTVQLAGPQAARLAPGGLRPDSRQPVLGQRPARHARRRLAADATLHHPITVDRDLDLADATTPAPPHDAASLVRLLAHAVPRRLAAAAHRDRVRVVQARHPPADGRPHRPHARRPVGVDHLRFRPLPDVARVPAGS